MSAVLGNPFRDGGQPILIPAAGLKISMTRQRAQSRRPAPAKAHNLCNSSTETLSSFMSKAPQTLAKIDWKALLFVLVFAIAALTPAIIRGVPASRDLQHHFRLAL